MLKSFLSILLVLEFAGEREMQISVNEDEENFLMQNSNLFIVESPDLIRINNEINRINRQMKKINDSTLNKTAASRLQYLMRKLESHPEYIEKRQELINKLWRRKSDSFIVKCLTLMMGYIPPNISSLQTVNQLQLLTGYSHGLCERIFNLKSLWLIRLSKSEIRRLSYEELRGVYNPMKQGLDLVELAAVYKSLMSVSFDNDVGNRIATLKIDIEKSLMAMHSQYKMKLLPDIKVRYPLYDSNEPKYSMTTPDTSAADSRVQKVQNVSKNNSRKNSFQVKKTILKDQ